MTISINGTSGVTFNDASTQTTAATGFGFKNRIINGAMVIDQRNAGLAAVTISTDSDTYCMDRFLAAGVASNGVFTVQQVTEAPVGFSNSAKITVTTEDTVLTGSQSYQLQQKIEGFNTSDLSFGTANAKTVTLSFWARSSLTGTFGGALSNSAFNRSYPFTYSISVADTWEYKTVTIAGDTSGTWIGSTNGIGLRIYFGLGAANRAGTAGAWAGAGYVTATGAVSVIGTLNATFYITGVQLEKGSTATSFDYRPYGTELALCQRYLPAWSFTNGQYISQGWSYNTTSALHTIITPVSTRVAPTGITTTGSYTSLVSGAGTVNATSVAFSSSSVNNLTLLVSAASGYTSGYGQALYPSTSTATILGTGCEL